LTPTTAPTEVHLYAPRDGYRTRTAPHLLGPMIEYYLPAAPGEPVRMEILDPSGTVLATYGSDRQPQAGGGRRGGGDPDDEDAPMMFGRGRGGADAPLNRVTANVGLNRFVWDVSSSENLGLPPGQYQARLTVDGRSFTRPFNVLIDPRLAEEGVTVADLREQYEHNKRMRAMVQEVNQLVQRVRTAQTQAREAGDQAKLRALDELAAKLITEPVRYGKPGLQAHISYLA